MPEPPQTPYPLWLTPAIFLGVFAVLQWARGEARDTWVERLVIGVCSRNGKKRTLTPGAK